MRFLCLHGMGTNSKIFEIQTAAIRHGLGSRHTFEYIDGPLPAPMAPGVDLISDRDDEFLQYGDSNAPETYGESIRNLEALVDGEGPFDGVMAFSQGAALAASLIIHKLQKTPREARLRPVFRCAIFFCGGVPENPSSLLADGDGDGAGAGAGRRLMSYEQDGEVIEIPTAHIWGANDRLYPTFGPVLSKLCHSGQRADFIHQGGHEIPGPKDPDGVLNAIRVIKRAIQRADEDQ